MIDFQKRADGPGSDWDNVTGLQHYVALIGANGNASDGIVAADADKDVINVVGPVVVMIQNLKISGGKRGVRGDWGAIVGVLNSATNSKAASVSFKLL